MAKGVEDLASSQIKRAKLTIEADRKRDKLFLKHKEEEAKRNRKIVQITTSRCTITHPQTKNFDRISCQHLHNLRPPNPTLPVQEMKHNFIIMV